ncbi:signal peptidase I [Vibrio fluvialis]|uniref:signal peptidase I n=1 Tax=Vibrio fluvialis TaxID=676 RepID=UPI001EECA843|nr:signal peptidase I [Vibrio fluvialis]MCG6391828.1 signal peptidase I [Vibrio fluvialis]
MDSQLISPDDTSERRKDILTWCLAGMILLSSCAIGLSTRYTLSLNTTESLDYRVFITDKRQKHIEKGEYVKFLLPPNKYFYQSHWTKRVAGVPGDTITVNGRDVYVNGQFVGHAKDRSATNTEYFPIEPGIIPPGYYFMQADHEDSYDSRYKSFGLVHESTFIGRDYPLWKRGSSS